MKTCATCRHNRPRSNYDCRFAWDYQTCEYATRINPFLMLFSKWFGWGYCGPFRKLWADRHISINGDPEQ